MKLKTIKIENGPKLVLCQDKTKNQTYMQLIVNFGGAVSEYTVNNQTYPIEPGLAHLLEHKLIEDTIYGNLTTYYKDKYTYVNGATTSQKTWFELNMVENHKERLNELLTYINKPIFNEEKLKEIKLPIMEEINMVNDNHFKKTRDKVNDIIYGKGIFRETGGTQESVNKITSEDLKQVHKVFYQPNNQIIYISGNFDINDTIDDITKFYKELNNKPLEYTFNKVEPTTKIKNKENNLIIKDKEELLIVDFVIDISSLKPLEVIRDEYYLSYFLQYNFSNASIAFKKVMDNNYSHRNFNFFQYLINPKTKLIEIMLYTKNYKKVENIIFDIMKNRYVDKKDFERRKKQTIVHKLTSETNFWKLSRTFASNIVEYNYDGIEDEKFLNSLNFEEYKTIIENLNLENYSILRQKRTKDE